jgi:vitamin B12 transporter
MKTHLCFRASRPAFRFHAILAGLLLCAGGAAPAQDFATLPAPDSTNAGPADTSSSAEPVVVSATRLPVPEAQAPSAISVITDDELAARQTDRVADALSAVPGLDVVQTGTPGQLTSVFTRGTESRHTEVLIDGIPISQGLDGAFDFSDLTTDGLQRIEVQRGPQSTLYGPSALGGVIQLFSRRGDQLDPATAATGDVSVEGGSFTTLRERASVAGTLGNAAPASVAARAPAPDGTGGGDAPAAAPAASQDGPGVFDYAVAASRLDTDNDRPNDQYQNSAVLADFGFTPRNLALTQAGGTAPRLGLLFTYSYSATGDPDTIYDPSLIAKLFTERELYAPNLEWQLTKWWHHRLILEYDTEYQVNSPNDDTFTGPTAGHFDRYQIDYQNDIAFTHWLTLTTGAFYENAFASLVQPQISQAYGPEPTYVSDFTDNVAGFGQVSITPVKNALLVAGGRFDHFNLAGDVGTYRVAGSYLCAQTGTTLRSSVATGFSPPTPQDRIYSLNPTNGLRPEKSFGYDAGFEQSLWHDHLHFGANYFHEDLSNVIGGDPNGNTFNLGSARTQGIEAFGRWEPIANLVFNLSYTYLDARNTSPPDFADEQPASRLVRRARNQGFASVSYRAFHRLTLSFEAKIVNGIQDIGFPPPNYTPMNFNLGGYTVLRLLASYDVGHNFAVYGRVENLGDERYQQVYGYPALGRGFFGGASYHF